jgi:hypothetical protein
MEFIEIMNEDITNQISDFINVMGIEIFQTVIIYIIIPLIGVTLLSRFVLRIRGNALKFILFITFFICICFYGIKGLPEILTKINKLLEASI